MVQSHNDDRAPARSERGSDRARAVTTSAVVLCGGRSSRMGEDKARLELAGETLVARALRTVASLTPHVRLACGPTPRYEDLGVPLVLDRFDAAGPLAGLEAALASAPDGLVIAVACDMPRLSAPVLERLVAAARERDLDVALLRSDTGLEPLCAVWRTSMLHALRSALERGDRRVVAAFEAPLSNGALPRVAAIDMSDADELGDCAWNVNTPADFERERARTGMGPASGAAAREDR